MRVIELRGDDLQAEAFVVIDHELFPVAAGGTRMLPDVDREEVARLARAMTWKFAACGMPLAGAKAGIRFAGGDRAAVVAAYRRALEPYSAVFQTAPDMGTYPEDFLDEGGDVPLWGRTHDGLGMDDLATGHGVKAAAEAALAQLGRSLDGAAVAIEGFGKVGAGTARACARAGARVVGVSTVHGALLAPGGLDVNELFELRERHGERFVEHGARPADRREALFELECDVLVPGARPDSITRDVAERIPCSVVAPAANVPYGAGAIEVLHRRGIAAVPDFVSNSGGVHLYVSVEPDDEPETALEAIEAVVRDAVVAVLERSEALRVPPVEAALRNAREDLAGATDASDDVLDALVPVAGASPLGESVRS